MNPLAHIFLSYFAFSLFIPDTQKYFWPIFIFAVIIDLDHLPGMAEWALMRNKRLSFKRQVEMFRTAVQEPIGILTICAILMMLYLFGIQSMILLIAFYSLLIHWLIDFLTVHTRPLAPIDNRIVSVFFHTPRQRVYGEIAVSILSLVCFIIALL